MKKQMLLVIAVLLTVGFGCSTGLPTQRKARPPRRIDWEDPISVTRGFFAAKKRGDWKTAYRCCDYEETLPREERRRIKARWKAESKEWPVDYRHTFWILSGVADKDGMALVKILVSRRDPITHALRPAETYQEKLKKYKNRWKITSLLPAEEPE